MRGVIGCCAKFPHCSPAVATWVRVYFGLRPRSRPRGESLHLAAKGVLVEAFLIACCWAHIRKVLSLILATGAGVLGITLGGLCGGRLLITRLAFAGGMRWPCNSVVWLRILFDRWHIV